MLPEILLQCHTLQVAKTGKQTLSLIVCLHFRSINVFMHRRKLSKKSLLLKSNDNDDNEHDGTDDVDVDSVSGKWSDHDGSSTECSTSSEDNHQQRSRASRSRRTNALNTPTSSRPCSRQARRHSQSHASKDNDRESAGSDCKISSHQCTNLRHFSRTPQNHNRSVSRLIAEKILTKSIARTRKKRYAATAAAAALKHVKDSSSSSEETAGKGMVDSYKNTSDKLKSVKVRKRNKSTYTSEEDSECGSLMKKGDRKRARRSKESDEESNKRARTKDLQDGLRKVFHFF